MTINTILALLGLALVDALNPFSIAAMAFLLSTNRPLHRGITFIIGTAAVYIAGGILLLEGWLVLLRALLPTLPPWMPAGLEMAAGAVAIAIAVYTWRGRALGKAPPSPANLSLPATFIFAVVSTISDLPTAVPYFAAASQIAATDASFLTRYVWLAFYNLIYVAPLVAMLALRLTLGQRAEPALAGVRKGVEWSFAKLLPPMLALAGVFLLGDAARRFAALG